MRAAVIEKPGIITIKHVLDPKPRENEILIKVKASGICGTDIHIFRGEYLGGYPIIPGHEFSGIVVETGSSVTRFKSGDRVAVEPNISCNNCDPCLSNRQNFCKNWSAIGVTREGGMAEYVAVPEQAAFSIGNLDFPSAALMEPLACVLHGVQKTGVSLADRVAILGAGPIGLLLLNTILLKGASEITVLDKNESRLKRAEESGASSVLTSFDNLPKDHFDLVIDATGVPQIMQKTLDFVREGGKILLFGVPPSNSKLIFDAFTIFRKGLSLHSSYTSVRNSIQAIRLLTSGRIQSKHIISHQLPLDKLEDGMTMISQGKEGVMKVIIDPSL
jgi:D-arabinitol dehydrogenase (NADP+)